MRARKPGNLRWTWGSSPLCHPNPIGSSLGNTTVSCIAGAMKSNASSEDSRDSGASFPDSRSWTSCYGLHSFRAHHRRSPVVLTGSLVNPRWQCPDSVSLISFDRLIFRKHADFQMPFHLSQPRRTQRCQHLFGRYAGFNAVPVIAPNRGG